MKKWDILVIIIVVVLAGGMYFLGVLKPKEIGGEAVIYVEGKEEIRLNLNEEQIFTVTTKNGKNVIKVENGQVFVSEADCPDGICVNHRPIYLVKESITCLPHKMIIEIENAAESDIDAVAG